MNYCHRIDISHPPSRPDLIVGDGSVVEDSTGEEWCCHSGLELDDVARAIHAAEVQAGNATEDDSIEGYRPVFLDGELTTDYDVRFNPDDLDTAPAGRDRQREAAVAADRVAEAKARREQMLKSPKQQRYDQLEALGVFQRMGIKRPDQRGGR